MTDKERDVMTPDEISTAERLYHVRREIKKLKEEENSLKQGLHAIPNGFRTTLPGTKIHVIRTAERLLPTITDANLVPREMLKNVLDRPVVNRHFRSTGHEPDGVAIRFAPGALTLR